MRGKAKKVKRKSAEPREAGKGSLERGTSSRIIGLGKFRSGISDLGSAKKRLGKFGRS